MDILKEACGEYAQRCMNLEDVLRIVRLMSIYPYYMIPTNSPTQILYHVLFALLHFLLNR